MGIFCLIGIHQPIVRFDDAQIKEDGIHVPIAVTCQRCPRVFNKSEFRIMISGAKIGPSKAEDFGGRIVDECPN
jgi:hypothetical protein